MKDNKDNMIDELIIKYLTDIASDDECVELEKWVNLSQENSQYFKQFQTVWENSSNLKAYQLIDTESSLKNVKKRINFQHEEKSKVRPLWMAMRIAAVLVILFGIYLIFRQNDNVKQELKYTKIESVNQLKTVVLPDSTVVNLNRNSHIEYAADFNKSERRLKFEGEAYFEIKPDKSRPFIIETSRSETRVLGTAFNLKAYNGSKTESIVVTHGVVEFSEKSNNVKHKVRLEKGEMAVLSTDLKKEVNTDLNYLAWKTGIITFKNEPLPKALKFLSEYYHAEINIKDSSIVAYTVAGKYEKKSLQEMLEILEFTLMVKVEKENGKYWLKKSNQ